MKIKDLIEAWQTTAAENRTTRIYSLRLPLSDAARIAALADMYPGRTEEQIIMDLLSVVLDEVEGAFPYVQGQKIINEDECGDPIYEDAGLNPRFQRLTQHYLQTLETTTGSQT